MASSIITIYKWSIFRLSSACFLILWAFNPLGSQASFRGIVLRPAVEHAQGRIAYRNPNFARQTMMNFFGFDRFRAAPYFRALYFTTLYDYTTSTQYVDPTGDAASAIVSLLGGERSAAIAAAMDPWDNVRIPSLRHLPAYNISQPHQWTESPWDTKVLNYSSLLGDRIKGLNRSMIGNTSFVALSVYQQFNVSTPFCWMLSGTLTLPKCSPWLQLNATTGFGGDKTSVRLNDSEADDWLVQKTGQNYQYLRQTPTGQHRTFFVALTLENSTAVPRSPELVFGTRGEDYSALSLTMCTARTIYVEANMTCISKGETGKTTCGVCAMREMSNTTQLQNGTVLDSRPLANNSFKAFMDMLDESEGGSGQSNIMELLLADPATAITTVSYNTGYVELGRMDIDTFESRFSLFYNTLWNLSWRYANVVEKK
jgi:hypothetical protein